MRKIKSRCCKTSSGAAASEVFSQLFVKLYPRLCNFAAVFLHDCEDAREVVTQVFEKLWIRREMLKSIGNVPAYLYAAVKTNCINQRKRARVQAWHRRRAAWSIPVNDEGLPDDMFRDESICELRKLINTLPDQRRRVMQLAYQDGLRNREIAHDLGLSLETIKSHRKIGLAALRMAILCRNR